jgi:hypothetical protein
MGLILSQQKSSEDIINEIREIIISQKQMKSLSVSKLQSIKSKLIELQSNTKPMKLIKSCIEIYDNAIQELTTNTNNSCSSVPSQKEVDNLLLIEQINSLPKPPTNMNLKNLKYP